MNQQIITYKNKDEEVQTYLIDNDIWLSRFEIAKLFNKEASTITRTIKKIEAEKEEIIAKMQLSHSTKPITIYASKTVIEIGKLLGSFDVLDFESWVNQTLINQNNSEYQIVRYNHDNFSIDVKVSPQEETVWLNVNQIAILYDRDRSDIAKHINTIYENGELSKGATCAKNAHMGSLGLQEYKTSYYNLDMILAIGYRVNGERGIAFRRWASNVLSNYLIKGYAINADRVEQYPSMLLEIYKYMMEKDKTMIDFEKRLKKVEISKKEELKTIIVKNGEIFDGMALLKDIVDSANEEIILIDPYADRTALKILTYKKPKVNTLILLSKHGKLNDDDIETFNAQYGGLAVIKKPHLHDRFIIIDQKKCFILGTSINGIGKSISSIIEINEKVFISYVIKIHFD